jgi:hypothetical protein
MGTQREKEETIMKRVVAVVLAVALMGALGGVAFAAGPYGPGMGMRWSAAGDQPGPYGMPGHMWMMRGRMGGDWTCPGLAGAGPAEPATAVTEEKAKELATAYVDKHFKGYAVERVLPFEGRRGTAYQIELKGPKGETRLLHVNPWGYVRPFGPVAVAD